MKKIIIGVLSLVLISLFSAGVLGCSDGNEDNCIGFTVIKGHITDKDGAPVEGAKVTIECNDNPPIFPPNQPTLSLSNGRYWVLYAVGQCNVSDTVTVTATTDGSSGTGLGVVQSLIPCIVNIAIVNVSIPEFTIITAGIALTGALFGLSIFRKHRGE